jgi:hypothetical protein
MGQYGNQPDFGTTVRTFEGIGTSTPFPPSAIYIGQTADNVRASMTVLPVGNPPEATIAITGISPGTFLPIVITQIIDLSNVDAANVLLYR